jgi:hypothetical protein
MSRTDRKVNAFFCVMLPINTRSDLLTKAEQPNLLEKVVLWLVVLCSVVVGHQLSEDRAVTNHLEYVNINGMIILKYILKK